MKVKSMKEKDLFRFSSFEKAFSNFATISKAALVTIAAIFCLGINVTAQTLIYTNGTFNTGANSLSGVAAPAGTEWSEVPNDFGVTTAANTSAGSTCNQGTFRLADDFNVPAGQTWTINSVVVYGYLTGSTPTTTPFTSASLRIWRGRPGDTGSTIVFGDTTTNVLGTSTFANLYRTFNSVAPAPGTATGTTRPVYRNTLNVSPAVVLQSGNYWIDWGSVVNATPATAHFCPPVSYVGTRGVPGWNGRQLTVATSVWTDAVDAGNPAAAPDVVLDFPFQLNGSISGAPAVPRTRTLDFNGDNRSDWVVARATNATSQANWWILPGGGGAFPTTPWGLGVGFTGGDIATPADFDGDGRTDIAVWRPGAATVAAYYILQSSNNTARLERFGQTGDDPTLVDDYDGDGRDEPAVFRPGAQGVFYYRGSLNNPTGATTFVSWGTTGDKALSGDYNGDGRADYQIVRNSGGQAVHFILLSGGGFVGLNFGLPTDKFYVADFDGDARADACAVRTNGANYDWYILRSSTGSLITLTFGNPTTDYVTPGDYDGDGKSDFAVWRSGQAADQTFFFLWRTAGSPARIEWGQSAGANTSPDYPVATFNVK